MSKPVVFAMYHNPIEASLVRNRLEAEGIRVLVEGDTAADAFAGLGGAFATVKLEVAEDDLERARAVLDTVRDAPTAEVPATDKPVDVTAEPPEGSAVVGDRADEGPEIGSVEYRASRALRAACFSPFFPPIFLFVS